MNFYINKLLTTGGWPTMVRTMVKNESELAATQFADEKNNTETLM